MNVSTKLRCPLCGGKGTPMPGRVMKCKRCGGMYDGNQEGIVAPWNDPVKSAETYEQQEMRRNGKAHQPKR